MDCAYTSRRLHEDWQHVDGRVSQTQFRIKLRKSFLQSRGLPLESDIDRFWQRPEQVRLYRDPADPRHRFLPRCIQLRSAPSIRLGDCPAVRLAAGLGTPLLSAAIALV